MLDDGPVVTGATVIALVVAGAAVVVLVVVGAAVVVLAVVGAAVVALVVVGAAVVVLEVVGAAVEILVVEGGRDVVTGRSVVVDCPTTVLEVTALGVVVAVPDTPHVAQFMTESAPAQELTFNQFLQ